MAANQKQCYVAFKYVRNPFIDQSYFFLQVLVIGAGDGGVIRDVSKHPLVESIVQCEIDEVCCLAEAHIQQVHIL